MALDENWRKSRRSGSSGACFEARRVGNTVFVRNSNRPEVGEIPFTLAEWEAANGGFKDGDFDL